MGTLRFPIPLSIGEDVSSTKSKNKTKRNLKKTCHIIVMGLFYGEGVWGQNASIVYRFFFSVFVLEARVFFQM